MNKTILITGSTDGIGLETAKTLTSQGHTVLLHGRSEVKLDAAAKLLSAPPEGKAVETYVADLSNMSDVEALANAVSERHAALDVLINNAGVLKTPNTITGDGLDVRFAVNTIAPYLLTHRLLPLLGAEGRVINLSSAAQAPVDTRALIGEVAVGDMPAYSQSKLAITMWSRVMAEALPNGPVVIALNPGSLLASKMVKEGFGMAGSDLQIGADIVARAALSDEFANASGAYFDNDSGRFSEPHPDALEPEKCDAIVQTIEALLDKAGHAIKN